MEEMGEGISVFKALKQVMDTLKQNMEHQFNEMHVTGPQGMLMGTLVRYGEMKISDLSEKLGLSNSTVSGIIDRLEKQGLVQRIRSKEDRRVVLVNVTSEFKRNAEEHFKKIEKTFDSIMDKAAPDELHTILEGLNTLKRIMDR